MSLQKKKKLQTRRRSFRVRSRQLSRGTKLRISVFRSLKNIYVQIIDDGIKETVVSMSSALLKDHSGDKKTVAKKVGLELSKMANEKAIKEVFFDRGRYLYHGRVRALAEGLREGGLKF